MSPERYKLAARFASFVLILSVFLAAAMGIYGNNSYAFSTPGKEGWAVAQIGKEDAFNIEPYPFTETLFSELEAEEIAEEKYFRLVDNKGHLITVTGRRIRPGDRYLDQKNRLYEVYSVRDNVAKARYIRTENLDKAGQRQRSVGSFFWVEARAVLSFLERAGQQDFAREKEENGGGAKGRRRLIALYHTHNAESYVPSDGTHSIYDRGGIHEVGAAFKEALEEKNIDVLHSENMHLPHDRGAYRRSRNTALELLEQNPDAIFDIHRDAAPAEAYAAYLEEDWVARIQFVVGRQNPAYGVTRRFAYDLKGIADQIYPGLVKGVFMGWGNYNQDLTPLNLLLEVGGHQNSKDAAENGITLFADVVGYYFYGIPADEDEAKGALPGNTGAGAVTGTIAAIILFVAAALSAFYFLNNPAAWGRFKEGLRLYLGGDGLAWKQGKQNLVLLGKNILSVVRSILFYLLLLLQLVAIFVRQVRAGFKRRLK